MSAGSQNLSSLLNIGHPHAIYWVGMQPCLRFMGVKSNVAPHLNGQAQNLHANGDAIRQLPSRWVSEITSVLFEISSAALYELNVVRIPRKLRMSVNAIDMVPLVAANFTGL